MHKCTQIYTTARVNACTCVYMYTHMEACTCICMRLYTNMQAHGHACVHIQRTVRWHTHKHFYSCGSKNESLSWLWGQVKKKWGGVACSIFNPALFECLTLCRPYLKMSPGATWAVGLRVLSYFLLYVDPYSTKPTPTT